MQCILFMTKCNRTDTSFPCTYFENFGHSKTQRPKPFSSWSYHPLVSFQMGPKSFAFSVGNSHSSGFQQLGFLTSRGLLRGCSTVVYIIFPLQLQASRQWSGILKPSGGVMISPAGIAHTNPFPHDHGPRHRGGGFGGAPFEFGKLSLGVPGCSGLFATPFWCCIGRGSGYLPLA